MSNRFVRATHHVEDARQLDPLVAILRPVASRLAREPRTRWILHGHWLGHAVHPLMTDFPLGMWLSGTVLDLRRADTSALALYAASWRARRRGDEAAGTALAVAGGMTATAGGYLGGHLTEVRKVSSRHPSFEGDRVVPAAS